MQLIERFILGAGGRWYRLIARPYLRAVGLKMGGASRIVGLPIVSRARSSEIIVGENCVLCSKSWFTALGVNHPVVLRTLRPGAQIRIGNNVGLSGTTICAANRVEIGDNVLLGANVTIVDTDFHPIEPEGRRDASPLSAKCAAVHIQKNVFVGAGSIILKGVTVGENSVIGAGSVVSSDVPKNSIAAGNPCRVIRPLKLRKPETASTCTEDATAEVNAVLAD